MALQGVCDHVDQRLAGSLFALKQKQPLVLGRGVQGRMRSAERLAGAHRGVVAVL